MIDVHLSADLVRRHIGGPLPFHKRRVILEGAIITPAPDGTLVPFKVAAGFDVVEDTSDERAPVDPVSAPNVSRLLAVGMWERTKIVERVPTLLGNVQG